MCSAGLQVPYWHGNVSILSIVLGVTIRSPDVRFHRNELCMIVITGISMLGIMTMTRKSYATLPWVACVRSASVPPACPPETFPAVRWILFLPGAMAFFPGRLRAGLPSDFPYTLPDGWPTGTVILSSRDVFWKMDTTSYDYPIPISRELLMDILKYGTAVERVALVALRDEVKILRSLAWQAYAVKP